VQNTEQEAHEQLDYAIKERGINCIDTAEVYPVPSSAPGWQPGTTERYIGTWLAKNPEIREKVHVATKVAGYTPQSTVPGFRCDPPTGKKADSRLDRESILAACDASLRRLQTTYVDLYQLHWPDRYVPLWGNRTYDPAKEREGTVALRETALAMKALLDCGKIKAWGVSNETTWGVAQYVRVAKEIGMPPPATIQNNVRAGVGDRPLRGVLGSTARIADRPIFPLRPQFALLNRSFEASLAEACAPSNGNVGLLPWSILCGGALTGKYVGKELSAAELRNTRFARFPAFQGRFHGKSTQVAIEQYAAVAKEAGMSLATMAQAFCKSRWFIPSSIIGATSMEQLKENIDAFEVDLDQSVLDKIDAIHIGHLDPCLNA
jgi:aryl-alcohol dehydrogenase-like predicted oxidoreductase